MAPGPLAQVLRQLPRVEDDNLLTADIPFADAGVYRIGDSCALVQSVDFFTPIVNDPATYGRIAAANALALTGSQSRMARKVRLVATRRPDTRPAIAR